MQKVFFTKELDKALLEEEIDFAVHSFKDLPTELDEELEIAAVPKRVAPNEVLISNKNWDELGPNSKLGTSSLRREAFVITTINALNSNQLEAILKPESAKLTVAI